MFNPAGAVTSQHAHEAVALHVIRSGRVVPAGSPADVPIIVEPNYDIGIWAVHVFFGVGNNAAAGSFSIGTVAQPTAIVNAQSVASGDVGTWNSSINAQSIGMETTLVDTLYKHGAKPIVPAGTPIVFSATGTNVITFWIQLTYWRIQPNV